MTDQAVHPGTLVVVILTYNEEANIAHALDSVAGWASEIFVLDSLSTDRTLEIVRRYGCQIAQNKFENYAKQRNYALDHLPVHCEWVLFLDADEWLTNELKDEIKRVIASDPLEDGFFLKRRLMWMGTWIRRGYYPTWILRLFRRGRARCESRSCNEHLVIDGKVGRLKADFMHEDHKGISDWIAKHNRYATLEALELLNAEKAPFDLPVRFWHTSQVGRKRWLRHRIWNRMPPLLRPFFYFLYRSILCGGSLDGSRALIYHFLQALWYPLLIDIKYLELRGASRPSAGEPATFEGADGVRKSRC
jgi:glycosyltransferase involved in cell wall biosynthesis